MAKEQVFPKWKGQYAIVDADHVHNLETMAAINEFTHKMPRHEAEELAHHQYMREQLVEAAAHHLAGIKAAQGAGDVESVKKHGLMYQLAMRGLGHDPMGEPPAEVTEHMKHQPLNVYKFKAHKADAFAMPMWQHEIVGTKQDGLAKSEPLAKDDSAGLTYYHGTPDPRSWGKNGIHLGTEAAAHQALEARIGVPAEGVWDGTREYGKTLLAGKRRQRELAAQGRYCFTGHNCGEDVPEEDYYPHQRATRAKFSDGTEVAHDAKPIVFAASLTGPMTNTRFTPHSDNLSNGLIARNLKLGNARRGHFYRNKAEDTGSVSAVVPDQTFFRRHDEVKKAENMSRHKDGRFSYQGDFDRMCECGKRLGDHAAEPPHRRGKCEGFKPKKD